MNTATAEGTAKALSTTVPWARLHLGTWWTVSEVGWVRADLTTAATLDWHHAKLTEADANVAARYRQR